MSEPSAKDVFELLMPQLADALGLILVAVAEQGDAQKLCAALHAQLNAAKRTGQVGPIAMRLATEALAAVEGEQLAKQAHQDKQKH